MLIYIYSFQIIKKKSPSRFGVYWFLKNISPTLSPSKQTHKIIAVHLSHTQRIIDDNRRTNLDQYSCIIRSKYRNRSKPPTYVDSTGTSLYAHFSESIWWKVQKLWQNNSITYDTVRYRYLTILFNVTFLSFLSSFDVVFNYLPYGIVRIITSSQFFLFSMHLLSIFSIFSFLLYSFHSQQWITRKIYPMVRSIYPEKSFNQVDTSLCVNDILKVWYDDKKAILSGKNCCVTVLVSVVNKNCNKSPMKVSQVTELPYRPLHCILTEIMIFLFIM